MDGIQDRLKNSLQYQLAIWLSLAIISVALTAGVFSFWGAYKEANELQDDILLQVAVMASLQPASTFAFFNGAKDSDPESKLIIQPLIPKTELAHKTLALNLSPLLNNGFHTIQLDGASYRVLIKTHSDGESFVVAQETKVRNEIARDSALRTILPLLILIPILLLVVFDLVRKMLLPITKLATEINLRNDQELHSLEAHTVSTEMRPFVTAINLLFNRVDLAMNTQRRFIADAAHELRSPMTALSLQAERLSATDMSLEARERLLTLRLGIERGRNLLGQLLNFARAQNPTISPMQKVSVRKIYRSVLEELMPLAEAKQLDIGISEGVEVELLCQEIDLTAVIKNLVDNAILYTPNAGRIDLFVFETGQQIILEIEDSGVGIAIQERDRVLDPFYRVLGSKQTGTGLGLAIVKTLVDRLNGQIELTDSAQFNQGLKVRLIFQK